MKYGKGFFLLAIGGLLSFVLLGCATVKEMSKGFIGVSTKVLEDKRPEALKKSFALEYNDCYVKVKNILDAGNPLEIDNQKSEIYAQDQNKKMIAIYFSATDTTPVGIFFTEQEGLSTLIEVSSPSTYAKEEIANKIFTGLDKLIKPNLKEKEINVKEESGNQGIN